MTAIQQSTIDSLNNFAVVTGLNISFTNATPLSERIVNTSRQNQQPNMRNGLDRMRIYERIREVHDNLYKDVEYIPTGSTFSVDDITLTYKGDLEWDIRTTTTQLDLTVIALPHTITRQQTIYEEPQTDNVDDFESDNDSNDEEYVKNLERELNETNKHMKEMYERIIEIINEAESDERNDIEYLEERQLATIKRLKIVDIKIRMIKNLREELPRRKLRECGICFEKKYNFGRLPCCNVAYCMKCLEKCVRCPICRKREWWNVK